MASFNKLTLVGYLGKDPEAKYLPDGTAIATFSVASTEKRKDRNGETQDNTVWFRCNAFGKLAEVCIQYLGKGSQVYLEGRLSIQQYADKDGNQRTSLDVRASEVQFLDRKSDRNDSEQKEAPQPQAAKASHEQRGFGGREADQSVPF